MPIGRLAAAAGAAAMLMAGLGTATAASASAAVSSAPAASRSLPRIQTYSPDGWSRQSWKIRPGYVYFGWGAGYEAPRVKNVHWTYYQHGAAYAAHARWWMDTCKPTCVAGGYWVNARVFFYNVMHHRGPGWNYSQVRVTYRGGVWNGYINRRGWWV